MTVVFIPSVTVDVDLLFWMKQLITLAGGCILSDPVLPVRICIRQLASPICTQLSTYTKDNLFVPVNMISTLTLLLCLCLASSTAQLHKTNCPFWTILALAWRVSGHGVLSWWALFRHRPPSSPIRSHAQAEHRPSWWERCEEPKREHNYNGRRSTRN